MLLNKPYFKRFTSLTPSDYLSDHHIHSTWTDGEGNVREIIEKARDAGLSQVAVTDHVRACSKYGFEYEKEIRQLSKEYDFEVLVGFEAKVADYNGRLDISEQYRGLADFVIGSVHSIPVKTKSRIVFQKTDTFSRGKLQELEYQLSLAIIKNGQADILGHPGGMSLALHGNFDLGLMEEIIKICSCSNTAFEVNSRYHKDIIDWILKKLKQYNPLVSFSSDAHNLSQIGSCVKMLKQKVPR